MAIKGLDLRLSSAAVCDGNNASSTTTRRCGDGLISSQESCDDGNGARMRLWSAVVQEVCDSAVSSRHGRRRCVGWDHSNLVSRVMTG